MKLLIHDLNDGDWNKISHKYQGYNIISNNGSIRPCIGCFGCWDKDPGKCIIHDGYENMGHLIHHADEVVIISRYTWGGFSSFVKNVLDRSLGYSLPFIEIKNGHSYLKKRYNENKPFSFIFYGCNIINEEQKKNTKKAVAALCSLTRSYIKGITFVNNVQIAPPKKRSMTLNVTNYNNVEEKIILLNASMRSANSNSAKLADKLAMLLNKQTEIMHLEVFINRMTELIQILSNAKILVLCTPIYDEGCPSQLIRLLELFANEYNGGSKKIYVLSNDGLYDIKQFENLFSTVRNWCQTMNFAYCGGLGISAGPLIVNYMSRFGSWPTKKVAQEMDRFCEAINNNDKTEDIYTEPYFFPRFLYTFINNRTWGKKAKENGIRPEDLYRRL